MKAIVGENRPELALPLPRPLDAAVIGGPCGLFGGLSVGLYFKDFISAYLPFSDVFTIFGIATASFVGGVLFGLIERFFVSYNSRMCATLILYALAGACACITLYDYRVSDLVAMLMCLSLVVAHVLLGYSCCRFISVRIAGVTFGLAGGILLVFVYANVAINLALHGHQFK